jgi:hypothetical protein
MSGVGVPKIERLRLLQSVGTCSPKIVGLTRD